MAALAAAKIHRIRDIAATRRLRVEGFDAPCVFSCDPVSLDRSGMFEGESHRNASIPLFSAHPA
jgi:hypothetical protein